MDISVKTSNGYFSLRSAALIMDKNQLLVAKSDRYDCFYTVGGGVSENETTEQAVIREVQEETGYRMEIERLVFVQERFYKIEDSNHHEIVFFYLMKNVDVEIGNGACTDQRNEHLHWLQIGELENVNLVPAFLKTVLKNIPEGMTHIVSYE